MALALVTMSEAEENVEALRSVVEGSNQFSSSFFQVKLWNLKFTPNTDE